MASVCSHGETALWIGSHDRELAGVTQGGFNGRFLTQSSTETSFLGSSSVQFINWATTSIRAKSEIARLYTKPLYTRQGASRYSFPPRNSSSPHISPIFIILIPSISQLFLAPTGAGERINRIVTKNNRPHASHTHNPRAIHPQPRCPKW